MHIDGRLRINQAAGKNSSSWSELKKKVPCGEIQKEFRRIFESFSHQDCVKYSGGLISRSHDQGMVMNCIQ